MSSIWPHIAQLWNQTIQNYHSTSFTITFSQEAKLLK